MIEFTPSQPSVHPTVHPKKNSKWIVIAILLIVTVALLCIFGCVIYFITRSALKCDESNATNSPHQTVFNITTTTTTPAPVTSKLTPATTIAPMTTTTSTDWIWIDNNKTAKLIFAEVR